MNDKELDLDLARTVLAQGELKLQAQLQIALAADQRAIVFAGFLIAIATALAGYWTRPDTSYLAGVWATATGGVMFAGALACVSAAWPRLIGTVGNNPENWWSDGVEHRDLAECLRKESGNYDEWIVANNALLYRNGRMLKGGLLLALLAPFPGWLSYWWLSPLG